MPQIPSVRSFLIADLVFQAMSRKWCVIGVFDRILAPKFPVVHPSLGLFVVLSDAEGEYAVRVEFCSADEQVLAVFEGIRLNVTDRLASVSFGLQTNHLPIPAPGRFFFKLYFNGERAPTDIPIEAAVVAPAKS